MGLSQKQANKLPFDNVWNLESCVGLYLYWTELKIQLH